MSRFLYVHFDEDVPRNVEKEYNRMLRREKYLEERDAEYLNQSADFDDVLEINLSEFEAEEIQKHNRRLDYLPVAMQMLRADYPEEYFLIRDYYYNQDKVSMMYLASKYGMTFEAVRYRIDRAKELLKDYITLHENI